MMKRFENKIAVVTGAAKGIGFAIAARLASEGAKVWLADRDESALAKSTKQLRDEAGNVEALLVDVTSEQSVIEGLAKVIAADSRLDILINSAGIVGPTGMKAHDVSYEKFRDTMLVNLDGTFLLTKYVLPYMYSRRSGRVLHIASIAGKEGNAGMSAYSASKAAVIGFVKAVGKEYAETGITVNALAPATVMTEMVEAMPVEQVSYMTDKIPMKRCCGLNEIASLASWIVSDEASFNTGSIFDISGGRAVY